MAAPPEAPRMEPVVIKGTRELNFGLRWDFVGNDPIDLDASCVSFDVSGNPGEVVFYNNLVTKGQWMIHTGDNTTGEGDDDDEAIQIVFEKIPQPVAQLILVVTCHNQGCYLHDVQSIECVVTDMVSNETLCNIPVTLSKDHNTAIILCAIVRQQDGKNWLLKGLNIQAEGHSVGEAGLMAKMQDQLEIPSELLKDRKKLVLDYDVKKGDVACIPVDMKHIMMGLGWSRETTDLDASAIMLNSKGEYLDYVSSKKKHESADHSCHHSGDNIFDGQGDRETIHLKLDLVSAETHFIYFSVTHIPKDNIWVTHGRLGGTSGYCRLIHISKKKMVSKSTTHNLDDRKELCRTNISKINKESAALLFAVVYRDTSKPGGWSIAKMEDSIYHTVWSIPGELLSLARCSSYFLYNTQPPQDENSLLSQEWNSVRELLTKRVHLKVTIVEATDITPQDEVFGCHCQVWLRDKSRPRSQRQRSTTSNNRKAPTWKQSFSFGVTISDCLRVMILHGYLVGIVDLPLVCPHSPTLWERLHQNAQSGTEIDDWHSIKGTGFASGKIRLRLSLSTLTLPDDDDGCCVIQ